jgi:murein DD-endopeptidase MepM/ murein hydrolase activator NlpD
VAKRRAALAITVASSNAKPPLRINLSRWILGLFILLALVIVGLASVTVYTLLDAQGVGRRGDNLSFQNSSSTREQEQEKLIKLGQDRLVELQNENAARKKDVDDLQKRVVELSNNIKSLQQLAKEIQQRLGNGGSNGGGDQTTPSGSVNSGGTGGAAPFNPTLDPKMGQDYTTQFSKVSLELDSLNKTILQGRQDMSALDVQVQSYLETFNQEQNPLNVEAGRLSQLAGTDGNKPPNTLPGKCIITSPFGMRWSPFVAGVRQMHYGVDIGCFEGTPVAVTKAGIVTYVGYDPGYGNRVEVTHAGGWLTLYAHNNRVLVKVGQVVQKGDIIALSGNTGASTGPHIHYELHDKGVPIDPVPLLAVPPVYQT